MFYKYVDEQLSQTNSIMFPDGNFLTLDTVDNHVFPVEDWYYFATEEEAKIFFNVPFPVLMG